MNEQLPASASPITETIATEPPEQAAAASPASLSSATLSPSSEKTAALPGNLSGNLRKRLLLVGVFLVCGWLVVVARLLGIYFAEADSMQNRVVRQQTTTQPVQARPGDILDRNGQLLATSVDTQSLYAVPKAIDDLAAYARKVAPVLGLEEAELLSRLTSNRHKGFLWLARRLEPAQAEQIRQLGLTEETFGFEREYRRHYPHGRLAVHLLGLRDIDGFGRGGVEQACQEILRGRDGERVLVRDALNRVVHLYESREKQVQQGQTVRLTIDVRLQQIVEEELRAVQEQWQPQGCCAALCNPQTGELLAVASLPDFHPEDPTTFAEHVWLNRTISWAYEPGSTIKPLMVAWAMQQQKVDLSTEFFGHWGAYRMGPRVLHDTHPYGAMTLAEVLVKSSNIGMAQIGERLTNAGLAEALDRFGFGFRTGVGLPGELAGFIRSLPEWNLYSTGSIPMGQELMVTPLQMLVAHSTLANGGHYRQPRLIQEPNTAPMIEMPVVNRGICRWIVTDPMTRVLTEGTGRRVNEAGLSLFGKTGTSQVYDPELGAYSNDKTVCSFVCGLPAEQPELLLIVVVDQPTVGHSHFGSNVAAPAAVQILKRAHALQEKPLARTLLAPIRQ